MAADHTAAAEMVRVSGQRGVPVIVIDGQVVVGFDRPRLEQLLAGAGKGPDVGLAVASASAYGSKHGLQLPQGAYVGRVRAGSPGERAGLRAGDVITALAGRPVADDRDLEARLRGLHSRRVPVTFWRNGETHTAELVF